MKHLIDFGLDVFEGCQHSCFGCQVIKEDSRSISEEEVSKITSFLLALRDDADEKKQFGLINIGPTDFTAGQNNIEVFDKVIPIMNLFDSIGLSCTMTYKEDILRAKLEPLKPFLNGRVLRIGIPLHPKNYANQQFHDLVDNNIRILLDVFDKSSIEKLVYQVNVVSFLEGKDNPVLNVEIKKLPGLVKDIDITIPDGRRDLTDLNNRLALGNAFKALKRLHDEHYTDGDNDPNSMSLLYSEGLLHGFTYSVENGVRVKCYDVDMFYYKGRLYKPGFYGEEVIIVHDDLSVPFGDGSPDVLDALEAKLLSSQMLLLNDECSSCEFSTICIENSNIQIKNIIMENGCIMPKENMKKFRLPTES